MATTTNGQTSDDEIRAAIRSVVDATVRAQPDGDVHAVMIRQQLANANISNERVTAALRGLANGGMLYEDRKAKVAGNDAAKDRKIIQYRATDVYKRHLGLLQPAQPVESAQEMLRALHTYLNAKGFVCSLEEVTNIFLCLQAKPFLILSGISGTGKTKLPRLIADAMDCAHQLVPVKPNWSDNSDLMGYYSVVQGRFVSGQMLEAIRSALDDPNRPHFVVLDEMNLAHVEHYLSDLLSIMETRHRDASGVVTSDRIPIELPNQIAATLNGDVGKGTAEDVDLGGDAFEWLADLRLPWNLFLVGTVNVDETTHPFSRKVLDRAFTVDYNEVDLTSFGVAAGRPERLGQGATRLFLERPLGVQEIYLQAPDFFDALATELNKFNIALREADFHFAYRVRDEIALYMWAWHRHELNGLIRRDDALDHCILQKVLPRCQGSNETARRALENIFRLASVVVPVGEVGVGDAAGSAGAALSEAPQTDLEAAQAQDVSSLPLGQIAGAIDPRAVTEPTGSGRWKYPKTARKSLAMLRRYVDTGFFAYWS